MEAANRETERTNSMPTTTTRTTNTNTRKPNIQRPKHIRNGAYKTPRTKRKREGTETGNMQAPKKQLKLTGLMDTPAEVGNERKEREKDKQEQGNKRSTQKYKQCNLQTMMGNKGRKESSEKYNREMERADKEGRGTKKRKKQKNKKVGKKKKKTEQTEIEGCILKQQQSDQRHNIYMARKWR